MLKQDANFPMGRNDSRSFGETYHSCLRLLEELSNKDAVKALKGLAGVFNLKISSAFAPVGQTRLPPASRDTRQQRGPRVGQRSDPRIKSLRLEISTLNQQISKKSVELGKQLSESDPLIEERSQLFRDLKEAQNKPVGPSSGVDQQSE